MKEEGVFLKCTVYTQEFDTQPRLTQSNSSQIGLHLNHSNFDF